jgi:hypothetical protein
MTIDMMSGMPMIRIEGEGDDQKFVPWSIPEVFNFKNMKVKPAPIRKQSQSSEEEEDIDYGEVGNDVIDMLTKVVSTKAGNEEYLRNVSKEMADIPVILFLDDAHLPDRSIQKYMFQLLGEKTIHKHTLPSNVAVVLAGNRAEDKAGFQQILAPVANRIRWIDVRYDLDGWVNNYALKNNIRLDVISFLQNNTESFYGVPLESAAWASPRSWTYASMEMDVFEEVHGKLDSEDAYCIVKGCVGREYATKFREFRDLLMQWEADKILSGQRKIVMTRKEAKNAYDIVIGKRNDGDGLDRIECYALMSATVASLIKSLRAVDFKPTDAENKMIDIFRDDIVKKITLKFREIVPLGLRSVLQQERQHRGSAITRRLLTDNEVVTLVSDIIK